MSSSHAKSPEPALLESPIADARRVEPKEISRCCYLVCQEQQAALVASLQQVTAARAITACLAWGIGLCYHHHAVPPLPQIKENNLQKHLT